MNGGAGDSAVCGPGELQLDDREEPLARQSGCRTPNGSPATATAPPRTPSNRTTVDGIHPRQEEPATVPAVHRVPRPRTTYSSLRPPPRRRVVMTRTAPRAQLRGRARSSPDGAHLGAPQRRGICRLAGVFRPHPGPLTTVSERVRPRAREPGSAGARARPRQSSRRGPSGSRSGTRGAVRSRTRPRPRGRVPGCRQSPAGRTS